MSELEFLREALHQRPSQRTLSGRFGLFCDLFLRAACVTSGEEAMSLLVSSKRIRDDLLQALQADDLGTPFDLQLVARVWSDGIREDGEFRGFLNEDGQLVALCQYNELFFQPELAESATQERLIANVTRFVDEEVAPALKAARGPPLLPCVCDFAVLQSGLHGEFDPNGPLQVVELNPANERTSTALFAKEEVLRWVFARAEGPPFRELRVTSAPTTDQRFLQSQLTEAHRRQINLQMFDLCAEREDGGATVAGRV